MAPDPADPAAILARLRGALDDGDESDGKCWLCLGTDGIALHIKWSEHRGKPLWTAHEYLSADTHPIRPCPVCTGRLLAGALERLLELAEEWDREALCLQGVAREQAAKGTGARRKGTTAGMAVTYSSCGAAMRAAITRELAGTAGISHDERCCMTGNPPGSGPHPDCPGYPYWPDERGDPGA